MQELLRQLAHTEAKILFTALQNTNDEGFLDFVRQNFSPIKAWLESAEFKQNYAHLPYPPLLEPSSVDIDASKHCAALAWNLNLPLNTAFSGGGGVKNSNSFISVLTA